MRTTLLAWAPLLILLLARTSMPSAAADAVVAGRPEVEFRQSDTTGELIVHIAGAEAFTFQYGSQLDLPHYFPVRSPSGKLLTVQQTEPYPHHRSIWFADKVELQGHPPVEFYSALYTRNTNDPSSTFTNRIRHIAFLSGSLDPATREIRSQLLWEAHGGTLPVLDEFRRVKVVPLADRDYLLDLTFTLVATYGVVTFRSDAVHYAWPFVRMHPQFSVDRGGTLVNSEGGTKEKGTHNQIARWVDYSNTVDGQTEGLAIMSHPENEHPHRWLTRDYGTFGPRRIDPKSGRPFILKKGEYLTQRVGILVHKGNAADGKVEARYRQYVSGEFSR